MRPLILGVVVDWRAFGVHVLLQFGDERFGRGVVYMRLSMLPITQPSLQITD
jgi:hypothetical protein